MLFYKIDLFRKCKLKKSFLIYIRRLMKTQKSPFNKTDLKNLSESFISITKCFNFCLFGNDIPLNCQSKVYF